MTNCIPAKKFIPFSIYNIEKIPNESLGLYSFWYNSRCVYVGQAARQPIKKRLLQHWADCHNRQLKTWINAKGRELQIAYCEVERIEHIDYLEKLYIRKFSPITNIIHNS